MQEIRKGSFFAIPGFLDSSDGPFRVRLRDRQEIIVGLRSAKERSLAERRPTLREVIPSMFLNRHETANSLPSTLQLPNLVFQELHHPVLGDENR
jgi:hypothetical protein